MVMQSTGDGGGLPTAPEHAGEEPSCPHALERGGGLVGFAWQRRARPVIRRCGCSESAHSRIGVGARLGQSAVPAELGSVSRDGPARRRRLGLLRNLAGRDGNRQVDRTAVAFADKGREAAGRLPDDRAGRLPPSRRGARRVQVLPQRRHGDTRTADAAASDSGVRVAGVAGASGRLLCSCRGVRPARLRPFPDGPRRTASAAP